MVLLTIFLMNEKVRSSCRFGEANCHSAELARIYTNGVSPHYSAPILCGCATLTDA